MIAEILSDSYADSRAERSGGAASRGLRQWMIAEILSDSYADSRAERLLETFRARNLREPCSSGLTLLVGGYAQPKPKLCLNAHRRLAAADAKS